MRITYENTDGNQQGEAFKVECRAIIQSVFKEPVTGPVLSANLARYNTALAGELQKRGYVYNRANMTLDPTKLEAQGIMVAVHGKAGDPIVVDDWEDGGMVCRFVLPVNHLGKYGAAS